MAWLMSMFVDVKFSSHILYRLSTLFIFHHPLFFITNNVFLFPFSGYCHSCLIDSSTAIEIICRLFKARGILPRSKTVIPLPRMCLRAEFDITMTKLMLMGGLKISITDAVAVSPGGGPPLITPHRPRGNCGASDRQGGSSTSTVTIGSSNPGTSGPSTQQNSPVGESAPLLTTSMSSIATLQSNNSAPGREVIRLNISGASNIASGSGNLSPGDIRGSEVRRQARMNIWQSDNAKRRRGSIDSSRGSKSRKSSASDSGSIQNTSDTEPADEEQS